MAVNDRVNTPIGIYILSGLLVLITLVILYNTVTIPSYLYQGIFLIPLFVYMSIGIIKRWPGTRQTVMVVAMIFFIGAFTDIIVTLFVEDTQGITSTVGIIENIVGLVILPVIFFYLRSEKVKSYFNQPPTKQINADTVQT